MNPEYQSPETQWDGDRHDRLAQRRAVEALRSGVPNADAVIALGSGQSDIEDRFAELLGDGAGPLNGPGGGRASMLLGAGFGQGKSHLLTHLGHLATSAGFVVSTVVISKETPLYDPAKVLRAAVESAVGPDGTRDVIAEVAAQLDTDSPGYAELLRWLRGPGRDMNERFEATILLHQRLSGDAPGADEEFLDSIVRFWSGDPLLMPDLRRQLKAVGEAKTFTFSPVKVRDLARQRLRFLPRLLRAGGHAGWVVLFDEVELIGRYSLLQRGRSYAELARWLDGDTPVTNGNPCSPSRRSPTTSRQRCCPARTTARACRSDYGTSRPRSMPRWQPSRRQGCGTSSVTCYPLCHPTRPSWAAHTAPCKSCTGAPAVGSRRTSQVSSSSARRGCASTCVPGSTNGISSVLIPTTNPSATWSMCQATTESSGSWTTARPDPGRPVPHSWQRLLQFRRVSMASRFPGRPVMTRIPLPLPRTV